MSQYAFLGELESIIADRLAAPTAGSYTARLAAAGLKRLAQKVGEEGLEVALAALDDDVGELTDEAADLVYHLLVLLHVKDLSLADVVGTLALEGCIGSS